MDLILSIASTIIGGGLTLFGIWLGTWLGRRREERHWRRDRCLEAYTDLLRCCDVVIFETDNAYFSEGSDRAVQAERVLEKVAEMYRASDRVTLLGPREIQEPLSALVLYCGKEIGARATSASKPSIDEWKGVRRVGVEHYAKFSNCARNDLGIHPPLHTLDEWRKILVK